MYEFYAVTDRGCIRDNNEDGFLVQHYYSKEGEFYLHLEHPSWKIAVADGMGGAEAGEIASSMTLKHLQQYQKPINEEAIKEINQSILNYGESQSQHRGLGTTLTGLTNENGELTFFHVGDSRLYRFRDGFLKQLSHDHSLVESLFQTGQIRRDEKRDHEKKHVILSCLGMDHARLKIEIDTVRGAFELEDLFLLCSDGLSDMLTDEQMEEVLKDNKPIREKAQTLVEQAKLRGGEDNLTIILVRKTK